MTKNFSKAELTKSNTATRLGIKNDIPEKYEKNLEKLMELLQTIRDKYGHPIIVTCGYRCEQVNKVVGGASNSDHKFAAAADIRTVSDSYKDNKFLFDLIVRLANEGRIECRQIIDEYNYDWIHVSINHEYNHFKKNQVLHIK